MPHTLARLRGAGLPEQFHAAVRAHIRGLSPGTQELSREALRFFGLAARDAERMGSPSPAGARWPLAGRDRDGAA